MNDLERICREGKIDQKIIEREKARAMGVSAEQNAGYDFFSTMTNTRSSYFQQEIDPDLSVYPIDYLEPGAVLSGRYKILSLLGTGGMGRVYLVLDLERDQPIALKCLHPARMGVDLDTKLRRELAINERLTHEGIVRTYTLDRDPQRQMLFLTMEYVRGSTLADLIKAQAGKYPPWPITQVLAWLHQLAVILDYAHANGVIHRDLKPANIMIRDLKQVKILDFGGAWEMCDKQVRDAANVLGTAYYMAPEQIEAGTLSAATDIYTLSVIAFQLITGRLPQPGMPGPSALIDGLARDVDQVLAKGMHWLADSRYQTAMSLYRDLQAAIGAEKVKNRILPQDDMLRLNTRSVLDQEVVTAENVALASNSDTALELVNTLEVKALEEKVRKRFSWPRLLKRITEKRPAWLPVVVERSAPELGDWEPQWQNIPRGTLMPLPPTVPLSQDLIRRCLLSRHGYPLLEFVYIPGGSFVCSGKIEANTDGENHLHTLDIDGFWIARTPVTNLVWSVFIAESGYHPHTTGYKSYYLRHWQGNHTMPDQTLWHRPVVWLSLPAIWAFCDFYGLSLPSEIQWEKAARGADIRPYPWGDLPPNPDLCNCNAWHGGITPVDQFPLSQSPFGLLDCVGNAFEWCADRWEPQPCHTHSTKTPILKANTERERVALRSSHYNTPYALINCSHRRGMLPYQSNAHTGFRPTIDWRR
jgi:serine/threonine protein kinase